MSHLPTSATPRVSSLPYLLSMSLLCLLLKDSHLKYAVTEKSMVKRHSLSGERVRGKVTFLKSNSRRIIVKGRI